MLQATTASSPIRSLEAHPRCSTTGSESGVNTKAGRAGLALEEISGGWIASGQFHSAVVAIILVVWVDEFKEMRELVSIFRWFWNLIIAQ